MNKRILKQCMRLAREMHTPEKHPDWGSRFNHFAFIIQDKKIIGWGFNRPSRNGAQTEYGYKEYCKIHAEPDSYRRNKGLIDHRKPFDVVNINIDWKGRVRMSCPCNTCFHFLYNVGCRYVFFSTPKGFSRLYVGGE